MNPPRIASDWIVVALSEIKNGPDFTPRAELVYVYGHKNGTDIHGDKDSKNGKLANSNQSPNSSGNAQGTTHEYEEYNGIYECIPSVECSTCQ